jgi:hypothetical protein
MSKRAWATDKTTPKWLRELISKMDSEEMAGGVIVRTFAKGNGLKEARNPATGTRRGFVSIQDALRLAIPRQSPALM